MSMMIVPIPHFNSEMAVEAYWLDSHNGKRMLGVKDNFHRMDDAFSHFGLEMVERIGIEPFTGGKPLFVPLSRMQLISGLMERSEILPEYLVCVIPAECVSETEAAQSIQKLYERGHKIALEGFPEEPGAFAMRYISYILLDYTSPDFRLCYEQVLLLPGIRPIICAIPDMKTFNMLKRDTVSYFTGSFYSRPITQSKAKLSPIKVNAVKLLNDINQEDFDFDDIVRIIEQDPYLSISLLKFLNSTASGLKRKVESIPQAVAILGQNSVRQWAAI
ncbi:MAG: HDOD domain-containing protein, partial [Firmicutes bacterium]|nr:HDOD domain-containing protein [Bacillota bacterium]